MARVTRLRNYESLSSWPVVSAAKGRSMLHWETLSLLWRCSRDTTGAVLEIGTYIGGATAVMAAARVPRRVICVQPEAAHLVHPTIPTDDVLRDLHATLAEFGVTEYVDVVEGLSCDAPVYAAVERLLQDGKIGLLVIDADGLVGRDILTFLPLLESNCILALDDYGGFHEPRYAPDKQKLVREWVHTAIRDGFIKESVVVPWGTWFGRLA